MLRPDSFTRWAGFAAIVSAPLAITSVVLLFAPVGFDFEAFGDAARMLGLDPAGAGSVRWGLLLDLLGYYLLLAPLAILSRRLVDARVPGWGALASWSAGAYVLVGAAGAAGLAAVYTTLAAGYPMAGAIEQTAMETVFTGMTALVVDGLWNTFELVPAAVWFLLVGVALRRHSRALGGLSLVLGTASLIDAAGMFLGNEALAAVGLNLYLVLAPVWAAAMGVHLLRRPTRDAPSQTSRAGVEPVLTG